MSACQQGTSRLSARSALLGLRFQHFSFLVPTCHREHRRTLSFRTASQANQFLAHNKTAECGGIEPPRPLTRPQTGFEDRPGHQAHAFRSSPLQSVFYYTAYRCRRVRTLTSPVRLVTPTVSEYSSQAWAYLRLVPRRSRSPASEISPSPRQTVFISSSTLSAVSLEAKSFSPRLTAAPRCSNSRSAGVGSSAGGSSPACCRSSSSLLAPSSNSGGTSPASGKPTPASVIRISPPPASSSSKASARGAASPVATLASATLNPGLSGRSSARCPMASSNRSFAATTVSVSV